MLADQANRYTPEFKPLMQGRRVDQVEFHPSWHSLMALYRGRTRWHAIQRWSNRALGGLGRRVLLHGQVEAGTLCPATMTQAAIPVIEKEPALPGRHPSAVVQQPSTTNAMCLWRKSNPSGSAWG